MENDSRVGGIPLLQYLLAEHLVHNEAGLKYYLLIDGHAFIFG